MPSAEAPPRHGGRLSSASAIVVFCLVPFAVALGGLPGGYTVVEMLLFAALLGAAALYVARAGSRGWG